MHALTAVRQAVGTVLYPVQMAALVPRDVASRAAKERCDAMSGDLKSKCMDDAKRMYGQ